MQHHKVVFTGPVGAGKSTAIQSLIDTPMLSTDVRASDMTADYKPTTTVAMDYATLDLTPSERVHLYGTPGQERFSFMWDVLTEGGLGLILLLDNTRRAPFRDLSFFTDAFAQYIDKTALVIGVTRMDLKASPFLEAYSEELERLSLSAPVLEVDARRRRDVSLLLQILLHRIDPEAVGRD